MVNLIKIIGIVINSYRRMLAALSNVSQDALSPYG